MVPPDEDPIVDRHHQRFPEGATLYYAGAPADVIYLIVEGRVRLIKRARGSERTTGVFGVGELVGEEALLAGAHRIASAEALTPVVALVMQSDTFRALTRQRPELGEAVTQQLVRRLQHAEEQIENALLPDPTIRVVNSLLHADDETTGEPIALSPLELSTRTGLDPERTKAVIGTLRDRGYVELGDQTITIVDRIALRHLHELLALKEDVRRGLTCR